MSDITIHIEMTVAEGTSGRALAEALFDFLADDPNDLFPQIEAVNDWAVTE